MSVKRTVMDNGTIKVEGAYATYYENPDPPVGSRPDPPPAPPIVIPTGHNPGHPERGVVIDLDNLKIDITADTSKMEGQLGFAAVGADILGVKFECEALRSTCERLRRINFWLIVFQVIQGGMLIALVGWALRGLR